MCNLFLTLTPPSFRHSLILLSNRDEVLARPTAEAAWRNGILSGIDLQDALRGTWFGINEQGKIGALLCITQKSDQIRSDVIGRGGIVHGFLKSEKTGVEYCDSLVATANNHNGYTFVSIDRPNGEYQMHSFTNFHVDDFETKNWERGTHVVGNCPPHKTYQKIERGRKLLEEALNGIKEDTSPQEIAEVLFAMGQDREVCFPDAQLATRSEEKFAANAMIQNFHVSVDDFDPRELATIFMRIGSPAWYGTRSQTVLIVNKDGSAFVRERRLLSIGADLKEEWESRDFQFQLPLRT